MQDGTVHINYNQKKQKGDWDALILLTYNLVLWGQTLLSQEKR